MLSSRKKALAKLLILAKASGMLNQKPPAEAGGNWKLKNNSFRRNVSLMERYIISVKSGVLTGHNSKQCDFFHQRDIPTEYFKI